MPNMRPYYTEYTNHMLRFYCKNRDITSYEFRTNVDQNNWFVCQRVVDKLNDRDKDIIITLYSTPGNMFLSNVERYAARHGITSEEVWSVIRTVSHRLAKARGLA